MSRISIELRTLGLAACVFSFALALSGCGDGSGGAEPPPSALSEEAALEDALAEDALEEEMAAPSDLEDEEVLEGLSAPLANPNLDPQLRAWLAKQAGAVSGPEAVAVLAEALDAEDEAVRHAAIDALLERDDPEVESILEAATDHSDPYVASKAREGLAGS